MKTETISISEWKYLQEVNSAIHEAAHLCAYLSMGIPATASIEFDGESGGRTIPLRHLSLAGELLVGYAAIAAAEYFQLKPRRTRFDLDQIETFVAGRADADALKTNARDDAESFVTDHKNTILKLAQFLLTNRVIDESTAKKIFNGDIAILVSAKFREALESFRLNSENRADREKYDNSTA